MTAARLGASFDLLAAWQEGGVFLDRDGVGIATGPGGSVAPGEAVAALAERPEGTVAAGALPFAGDGVLVIGDAQVRRTDPFVTTKIGEGDAVLVTGVVPAAAFRDAAVTTVPAPELYAGAVAEAVRRVETGELRKVVLARTIEVAGDHRFDPRRLAHRLRAVDPARVLVHRAGRRRDPGRRVAGAARLAAGERGPREPARRLRAAVGRPGRGSGERRSRSRPRRRTARSTRSSSRRSPRRCDRSARRSRGIPSPCCSRPRTSGTCRRGSAVASPIPRRARSTSRWRCTRRPRSAGAPTEVARAAIGQLEGFDRGSYAGPVGWVDADGNGVWAIALRCALLSQDRATLYAGAGIVGGSVPAEELDETDRKFRAFLDALRWG